MEVERSHLCLILLQHHSSGCKRQKNGEEGIKGGVKTRLLGVERRSKLFRASGNKQKENT